MAKVTNVNIDCSTNQSAQLLFELKSLLVTSCGWTNIASSNGTLFTTSSAGTDRVPTVTDFNVTNAYYVLQDPASLCWLYVQRGSTNLNATVKVSRVAPQTNGNATTLPTCAVAANEKTIVSATTFAGTSASARGHIIAYDAAENSAGVRPVYVMMTNSTTTAVGLMCIEAAADGTYASSNAYPWAVGHIATSNGLFEASSAEWTWYHSPTSAFCADTQITTPQNSSVVIAGSAVPGADPWTGLDGGIPILLGRNSTQAAPGIWGYMKNIRLRTVSRGYPDTTTTTGGERYVYIGSAIVPYENGTNPI